MGKRIHLIGIGGIGMSAIAKLLICRGLTVSGSDVKENAITQGLAKNGATIFLGHDAQNVLGADMVIYSTAIKEDNPEMKEAARKNIPLVKRAQALAELMEDRIVITVTGSHGKTTTSSLASYLLMEAGLKPTAAVGGILQNIDTNACAGEGKFFVAEADESDGSFLFYRPHYSILTNIDHEHLDYYGHFENEVKAFGEFMQRTREGGCVFVNDDDTALKGLLAGYKGKAIRFGMTDRAQVYAKNIVMQGLSSHFDLFYEDRFIDRCYLLLGGAHNISNALSVIALGIELGIGIEVIKKALANFKGASRRIEIKYRDDSFMVIDDYAHHPTEIRATLAAIRNLEPKRLVVVFQPHRYTRTKLLRDEFGSSFDQADMLILTDIYSAGEAPIEGVHSLSLYEVIKARSAQLPVVFVPKEQIVTHILNILKPGDLVAMLGAGDIVKTCHELVKELEGNRQA